MKPTVYIESSVVSYQTAWPSRDLVVAAHQQITHDWWADVLPKCSPFISQVVVDEIRMGDPAAARLRMDAVAKMRLLELSPGAVNLANQYLSRLRLPGQLMADCYHLAVASWHGMDYLVTWNCAHIASAAVRRTIEAMNAAQGIRTPVVCTPEELMVI